MRMIETFMNANAPMVRMVHTMIYGTRSEHFYIVCIELILDAQYSRILPINIVIKMAQGDYARNVFRERMKSKI